MHAAITSHVLWLLALLLVERTSAAPGEVQVVRYLGDAYFLAALETPEPPNASFLSPTGVAVRVLEGLAVEVYLLPFGEGAALATVEATRPLDYEAMAAVQERIHAAQEQTARSRATREAYQTVLSEEQLTATLRAQLERKIAALETEAAEASRRGEELQLELQELYAASSRPTPAPGSSWRPLVVGRLLGSGPVDLDLGLWGVRQPQRLSLTVPAAGPSVETPPAWLRAWAAAALAETRGPRYEEGYSEYRTAALERRFDVQRAPGRRSFRGWATDVSLYDIFSGSAALRESMQLDRMIDAVLHEPREVPISTVEPLSLQDHPFEAMRGGRPFVGSDLARLCPADALYLRVRSLEEWFRLDDLTDRWGGSLLSTLQVRGRDDQILSRYRRQLGLDNAVLGRLLGTPLIGELAVVAADPLFPEGTGLAVVFAAQEGKEEALHALFAAQRSLLGAAAGTEHKKLDLQGLAVDWRGDPAGNLDSYHCVLGQREVVCNSLELLRRMVAVARGAAPALHDAADFQYYRAIYPRHADESAFLFLSQDWFRKITGPGWRIAHGRRRAALLGMQAVRYAWQSTSAQGAAVDLATLQERRFIDPAGIEGLALHLDPSTGRVTSRDYGSLDHPRTVDELSPDLVSATEAQLYLEFCEEYERYWRQFIDPVGIQLCMREDRLDVETLILPLIENSIYGMLRMFSGDVSGEPARAAPLPRTALGAVTLRWSPEDAGMGELLNDLTHGMRRDTAFDEAWLGHAITLGVADADPLFTGAVAGVAGTFGSGFDPSLSLTAAAIISALALPTFAAVEVKDAPAVERFLEAILQQAVSWDQDFFGIRALAYETAGEPRIHTLTLTLFVVELRFHYAFVGPWLLLATKPQLLVEWMDSVASRPGADFPHNGSLCVRPPAFQRAAEAVGIVWQERIADACRGNLAPLLRARQAGWPDAEFLGYQVRCPEGGEYLGQGEELHCSLHGSLRARKQPLSPPETTPAVQLVNDLEELHVDFAFTGDGLRSHLTFRWSGR